MPPDKATLEHRLRSRGTDSEETISKRLQKSEFEMSFAPQFDCIVVNDNLNDAVNDVENRMKNFIGK